MLSTVTSFMSLHLSVCYVAFDGRYTYMFCSVIEVSVWCQGSFRGCRKERSDTLPVTGRFGTVGGVSEMDGTPELFGTKSGLCL